jgi:peptidoglycan/xylan/chitin deacetylase (PgdA/CDA1 family)
MRPAGLPILTYHALDRSGSVITTDPAWFAETMATLAGSGYRSVDLGDWIARGRPPVDRGLAITFDDGLHSIKPAADVLELHGFTATVFAVSGRMGGDNAWPGQRAGIPGSELLTWSDLRRLQLAGWGVGSHTRTHPRLDRLGPEALEDQLRGSRDEIEQRLGGPCRLAAYPYGVAPARVRRAAAHWFDAGLGTRHDESTGRDDPYDLPRIDAFYLRTRSSLRRLMSGRRAGWLLLRRSMRRARRLGGALVGA